MIKFEVDRREAVVDVADHMRGGVDVERFAKLCAQCPNFGERWSCPPFDFDPVERYWSRYRVMRVLADVIVPERRITIAESVELLADVKMAMLDEMLELECKFPGSVALSAGSCRLCADCAKLTGEPCRQPDRMRHSIEALGGDVGLICERYLGLTIEWGKDGHAPPRLTLVGALLVDRTR